MCAVFTLNEFCVIFSVLGSILNASPDPSVFMSICEVYIRNCNLVSPKMNIDLLCICKNSKQISAQFLPIVFVQIVTSHVVILVSVLKVPNFWTKLVVPLPLILCPVISYVAQERSLSVVVWGSICILEEDGQQVDLLPELLTVDLLNEEVAHLCSASILDLLDV